MTKVYPFFERSTYITRLLKELADFVPERFTVSRLTRLHSCEDRLRLKLAATFATLKRWYREAFPERSAIHLFFGTTPILSNTIWGSKPTREANSS
jgi:hypothetical protein